MDININSLDDDLVLEVLSLLEGPSRNILDAVRLIRTNHPFLQLNDCALVVKKIAKIYLDIDILQSFC